MTDLFFKRHVSTQTFARRIPRSRFLCVPRIIQGSWPTEPTRYKSVSGTASRETKRERAVRYLRLDYKIDNARRHVRVMLSILCSSLTYDTVRHAPTYGPFDCHLISSRELTFFKLNCTLHGFNSPAWLRDDICSPICWPNCDVYACIDKE